MAQWLADASISGVRVVSGAVGSGHSILQRCAPRSPWRHARQTRLRRAQACTLPPSAASVARAMQPITSGGSAGGSGSGASDMVTTPQTAVAAQSAAGVATVASYRGWGAGLSLEVKHGEAGQQPKEVIY